MFAEGCNKHFLVENLYSKLCGKNIRIENEEMNSVEKMWRYDVSENCLKDIKFSQNSEGFFFIRKSDKFV